ncbi:MAG TPA: efflux RND transporter permease subunit, partial [Thermoanaerobaculia bacterium]|nr:efflux RND transporter permease subunit [Thermoanaerobaculia bacterium]
ARRPRPQLPRDARDDKRRVSVVACVPPSISTRAIERRLDVFQKLAEDNGIARNTRRLVGSGFAGLDFESTLTDAQLLAFVDKVNENFVQGSEDHPDTWPPVVIRDPATAETALNATQHDKYSYRDLDRYTDIVKKTLQAVPQVSKITRSGVLKEKIYLDYSQERLASYGLQTSLLDRILSARNITLPGGMLQVGGKNLVIDPSGEFHSEKEIGDVIVSTSASGTPLYLRDLVDVNRTYETPARFLNFYQWRDAKGAWHRSRAVTLAVQMKSGEQIANFGRAVDAALRDVRARLPEDLVVARTSDQPLQVEENVDLFMKSLYEAIALVVLVALIGFWEWRSALLMALSIPLTLAMTFGMMLMLGVDLQQVSIASLIIALGLLVDDPVVAGDAIKRELAAGEKPIVAAWQGPTKLATAILFATITNIVAYLPLLLLRGDTGKFIYTLPVVLTCSLVASRIVSMTFIPLLGYYILRPSGGRTLSAPTDGDDAAGRGAQRAPSSRFANLYRRVGAWALENRWKVVAISFVFIILGGLVSTRLQKSFFPKDYSYLSYIDVWLPEDAPLTATNATAQRAEGVVRRVAGDKLASLTTFAGGGGPRFWFSVSPELQQLNYAQIVVQVKDKHDTAALVPRLQHALDAEIAGARCDVQQLETGPPIGIPVAIRISGTDIRALRATAEKVKAVFRSI